MEMVITIKATDSSQTEISEESDWDLRGYGVSPSLLPVSISESKCSSFIYYSICFTPLFLFLFLHIPFSPSPLGGAIFILGVLISLTSYGELFLSLCGHLKLCCLDVNKPLWSVSTCDFFLYLVIVLISNLIEESDKNKSENSKKPNKKPHMFFLVFRFGSYQHLEKLHLFAPIKPNIHNEKHLCINLLDTVLVVSSNC